MELQLERTAASGTTAGSTESVSTIDASINRNRQSLRWFPLRAVLTPRYKYRLARLRKARLYAGLTQVAAAKALGKTQAFMSKCELGERRIDPIDLQDFARLYKQSFKYFLPPEGRRKRDP